MKKNYKVASHTKKQSVVVQANNIGHAMYLARRQMKWRNYGTDTDDYGYKNYSIELMGVK